MDSSLTQNDGLDGPTSSSEPNASQPPLGPENSLSNSPPLTVPEAPRVEQRKISQDRLFTPTTLQTARKIGYGILVLGFADLLYIIIPPQITNPVWEYQAIGDIIKLVPVPLLALLLVFFGEKNLRKKLEKKFLKFLSWTALVIAILFFLLLPLIINDSIQINRFNNRQIDTEKTQQQKQLDATQKQLELATPEQLRFLIPVRDKNGYLPDLPTSPEQSKKQVVNNLKLAKSRADAQAAEARRNLNQNLVKNTIKLLSESFISGCLFLTIWSKTKWARQRDSQPQNTQRRSKRKNNRWSLKPRRTRRPQRSPASPS